MGGGGGGAKGERGEVEADAKGGERAEGSKKKWEGMCMRWRELGRKMEREDE